MPLVAVHRNAGKLLFAIFFDRCKERPTSDACALFKYRKMVTGPDGKKLDPLPEVFCFFYPLHQSDLRDQCSPSLPLFFSYF